MNRLNILLLLTIVAMLSACEYEPTGSNFIELTPPEDAIPIEITLNDIKPSDTIYIHGDTWFTVKINSTKDLQQAQVSLDGQVYEFLAGESSMFGIYSNQIDEGIHTLSVGASFASNSGSLANLMGLEGYQGELSWKIYVTHNLSDKFEVGYRTNEDGFLEVFWKYDFPDNYIEKYTIRSGLTQGSEISINDVAQRSFIDYGYVCGIAYHEITAHLTNGGSLRKQIDLSAPTPTIHFENLGLNKLRVFWDKPFANGRFDLFCDEKLIASELTTTTITIPQIFGVNRHFSLETRPQKTGYDNIYNKFTSWGWYTQGTSLGLSNWELFAYNKTDNIIYTTSHDFLTAFDANSMQVINSIAIWGAPLGLAYGGRIASAPHNSTVAAMTGEETLIYPNSQLVNPIVIPSLPGDVNTRLAALTSNDRFFVVAKDSKTCMIFNTLTGEKIFDLPFSYVTKYTFPDYVSVSENGQYFCASSENGIEVFEINGTATKLIYTDTRLYKGALFVPSQPDKLLLRVDSNIELRQIPGFKMIQTLDVSEYGAVLCNIDPVSMNLLYHQNDSLRVCNIDNLSETKFKIRSDEVTCKMYNNKLLVRGKGGLTFDVKPYLRK